MVLQQKAEVPVWGWADAGTSVEVQFGGQKVSAKADSTGYWKATLAAMDANATGQELSIKAGSNSATISDVLVGEVWIATGQSNMVHSGPDKDTGVYPHYKSTAGGQPEIRVRSFGNGASLEPYKDVPVPLTGKETWQVLKEDEEVPTWSIAKYFARVLRDELKVPVGMIVVAVPGTNQAAWMSKETLESFPADGEGANFYESFLAEKEAALAKGKGKFKSFAEFQEAENAWLENPTGLWPSRGDLAIQNYPSALYNTRIFPLAPFAARGVIWHQGEAGPRGPYGKRLIAMFKQWEELFGQDFYTIWGTLSRDTGTQPPLEPMSASFYRSGTNNEIRAARELAKDDPKAEYVEFYDLGDNDTHFLQKAEAGRRMGLAALTVAYGQQHIFTGPRLKEAKISGGTATLDFEHVGEGIKYVPSLNGISGVLLRGADAKPVWGDVKVVDADTIEVSSPEVSEIAYVGYALSANPHETLFNSAGIPASPFAENPGNVTPRDPKPSATLVKTTSKGLQLGHVRQSGYMFELKSGRGKEKSSQEVSVYIPAEWKGFEILIDGQAVEAQETTEGENKFATFTMEEGGPQVTVAEAGKGAEFANINRY